VVGSIARRVAGRLLAGASVRRGGGRRKRLGCIAVRIEERDDVGAVLWIAEPGEGQLGAGSEGARAGQPLTKIVPVPGAALAGKRGREGKALALPDRLPDHVPQVRAHLIGAALVGIVAGHALVEDLLAFGGVRLGEIDLDRLFGGGTAFTLLRHASNRIAHLLGALGMK